MFYLHFDSNLLIIGRDVRPLYSGSKGASERIRRQIIQARHLVRDCLVEVDRSQRS